MIRRYEGKNSFLIFVALVFLAVLSLCILGYQRVSLGEKMVISEEPQMFKVINFKQPKHFTMDLLDENANKIYKNVYISKHCMNWQHLKVNSEYTFNKITYRYSKEDQERTRVDIGNGLNFCQNLGK